MNNNKEATVQNWKEQFEQIAKDNQSLGNSVSGQSTIGNFYVGDYYGLYNHWYRPYQPCPGCGRCPICGHGGGHFGPYW